MTKFLEEQQNSEKKKKKTIKLNDEIEAFSNKMEENMTDTGVIETFKKTKKVNTYLE